MSKKRENLWKELGRPIYVGDRLQANLTGITAVSIVSMVLGIVMLAKGRGTQFDPELLNAFLKLFNRGILDDMQTIGYHMLFNQE